MGRIDRKIDNAIKKVIQAYGPEGIKDDVIIESMLSGQRINVAIPGVTNNYKDYESQVNECYQKYNGDSDWGNPQLRALIDFRVAFIAGEGVSISAKDEKTSDWIEEFIDDNLLNGSSFINVVMATEMAGQCLYKLEVDTKEEDIKIKVYRIPYLPQDEKGKYRPTYNKESYGDLFNVRIMQKDEQGAYRKEMSLKDSVPVITGGDDILSRGPTTKCGVVLNDIENYDRAVKDIRRLNHVLARITPVLKVESQKEAQAMIQQLADSNWKIGKMLITSGEFKYETPTSGAHDNLKAELVASIKNISSVTGVPVHWLGYVDLMSNRSTAETMYEIIKNATINERTIHSEAIRRLIEKAQVMYIDNGGEKITKTNLDFEITLPLLDFTSFLERVRALSLAFNDGVISKFDYQNAIPGIDPLDTNKYLEEEDIKLANSLIPPDPKEKINNEDKG